LIKSAKIHPDFAFLESLGVRLDKENDRRPICDPVTLESNVPGIYLAGVIVAGERTNEIFIENGRFHGKQIAAHLSAQRSGDSTASNALDAEIRHLAGHLRNQE
jgi:thioredoxin reductase